MFSLKVVDTDSFLEMPQTSQLLYFHLAMRADDDGFVNSPKKIMRFSGSKDDDLKILIAKQFIIPFQSGVIVIRHWKENNYIRTDRYNETIYLDEKKQLKCDENGVYTNGIPKLNQMDTQVRLGKDRLGKDRLGKGKDKVINKGIFKKPNIEDIKSYCIERKNGIDPQNFFDRNESIGWVVGRNKTPMKDWRASIRTWEKMENNGKKQSRYKEL